jgi:tetratricopeptide (TPR) repeat protein
MRIHHAHLPLALLAALCLFATGARAADQLVPFRYAPPVDEPAPLAVAIVGSFNEWKGKAAPMERGRSGEFETSIFLPEGDHAYRFERVEADGSIRRVIDPENAYYIADRPAMRVDSLVRVRPDGDQNGGTDGLEAFSIRDEPGTRRVRLGADFADWEPDAVPMRRDLDGYWRCFVKIDRPVTFKYVLNDHWRTDHNEAQTPDGFGETNSIRKAQVEDDYADWMQDPALLERELKDRGVEKPTNKVGAEELALAEEMAAEGNYSAAALLAQAIAANAADDDTTRRAALGLEADIHRRFGYVERAVVVWRALSEGDGLATKEGRQAANDLSKHLLHVERDFPAARGVLERLYESAPDEGAAALDLGNIGYAYMAEGNLDAAVVVLEGALEIAPAANAAADPLYAQFRTDLLMLLAWARARQGESEAALELYARVVAESPGETNNYLDAKRYVEDGLPGWLTAARPTSESGIASE